MISKFENKINPNMTEENYDLLIKVLNLAVLEKPIEYVACSIDYSNRKVMRLTKEGLGLKYSEIKGYYTCLRKLG